jgi:hypothetical protein
MQKMWVKSHDKCYYYKINEITIAEVSKLSWCDEWIAGYGFKQEWETFPTKEEAIGFIEEKFTGESDG